MLEAGKAAPAFTLKAADGDKVSLAGFKGKYLVVYFYPRDDTPGCTLEAQGFNKALGQLDKLGAAVVGVSKDDLAVALQVPRQVRAQVPAAQRSRRQGDREVRRLGREEHVRQEVDGHHPHHGDRLARGQGREGLPQGQRERPRRGRDRRHQGAARDKREPKALSDCRRAIDRSEQHRERAGSTNSELTTSAARPAG